MEVKDLVNYDVKHLGSRFHTECPYCVGEKPRKDCKLCRGHGIAFAKGIYD